MRRNSLLRWLQREPESAIITLSSGRNLDLLTEIPTLEEIAFGLANIVRWSGQTQTRVSVAEHCVRVSRLCVNAPLGALLHDAAESVLGDLNSPLKKTSFLFGYRTLEERMLKRIFEEHGLEWPIPQDVSWWDKYVGSVEYNALFKGETDFVEDLWPGLGPLGWSPTEARTRFLARYKALTRESKP